MFSLLFWLLGVSFVYSLLRRQYQFHWVRFQLMFLFEFLTSLRPHLPAQLVALWDAGGGLPVVARHCLPTQSHSGILGSTTPCGLDVALKFCSSGKYYWEVVGAASVNVLGGIPWDFEKPSLEGSERGFMLLHCNESIDDVELGALSRACVLWTP